MYGSDVNRMIQPGLDGLSQGKRTQQVPELNERVTASRSVQELHHH